MSRRAAFVTFGCKINFYDTQAIREAVRELGYEEGPPSEDTDLLVVNSCTVTERAGGKSVAAVRRLARRHPDARILVTGCLTGEDRAALAAMDRVEHVVGNEEKDQIPALIQGAELERITDRRSKNIFRLSASRFENQTRAYLKVHDGCDSFCTYCIIPFMRGKSKSRPVTNVTSEASRFAEAGHRELVLTGIHLSQYGRDLRDGTDLVDLLTSLREIPGVDRVRLSSIGEGAFSPRFLEAFRNDPGLCPFFHIPLQSGSDGVLQRMRRDYTVAEYEAAVARVREALPRSVVATDLMVGFPGETDAEFRRVSRDLSAGGFRQDAHLSLQCPRRHQGGPFRRARGARSHAGPTATGPRSGGGAHRGGTLALAGSRGGSARGATVGGASPRSFARGSRDSVPVWAPGAAGTGSDGGGDGLRGHDSRGAARLRPEGDARWGERRDTVRAHLEA